MTRQLLETKLLDLSNRLDDETGHVRELIASTDRLVEHVTESREQLEIYKEVLKELRKSKICSLREYREVKFSIWTAKGVLENMQGALAMHEEELAKRRADQKHTEKEIIRVKQAISEYGRLYRFPSNGSNQTV